MSARHQIDSIAFQTIDMGSRVVLGGLAPASHDIDQTVQPAESGSPYAHSHFVVDATERFQFTCKSLATLLENLQLLGPNCVDAATAGDGIDLFAQQLSECATGGRAAGSSHNRVRAAKARLFLRSLAFQGDASGTAQLEGVLLATDADGETAPSTTIYNAALETAIVDEELRRGPVQIHGVDLVSNMIQSVNFELGPTFRVVFGDGGEAVAIVYQKNVTKVTVVTQETDLYDAARLPRRQRVAAANTTFGLRRRDPATGGLVPKATTSHVQLSASGLMTISQPVSGSAGEEATTTIVIDGDHSTGTTPPIGVSTGVALT